MFVEPISTDEVKLFIFVEEVSFNPHALGDISPRDFIVLKIYYSKS